jgi:hypothetical protein
MLKDFAWFRQHSCCQELWRESRRKREDSVIVKLEATCCYVARATHDVLPVDIYCLWNLLIVYISVAAREGRELFFCFQHLFERKPKFFLRPLKIDRIWALTKNIIEQRVMSWKLSLQVILFSSNFFVTESFLRASWVSQSRHTKIKEKNFSRRERKSRKKKPLVRAATTTMDPSAKHKLMF